MMTSRDGRRGAGRAIGKTFLTLGKEGAGTQTMRIQSRCPLLEE